MRVSSVLVLAGSALASANADCLVNHSEELASFADCGHQATLANCLSQLESFTESDVRSCYANVGCSPDEAEAEAKYTLERCQEMDKTGDLKKRYRAAALPVADVFARATTAADATAAKSTQTGGIRSGDDCLETKEKSTTNCPLTTTSGKTITGKCTDTVITTSSCYETLICTVDSANTDICMDREKMSVGGIVVALVFAGALVLGAAGLTFACCKDRKEQKRLAAKAEATALARAATKKQRAAQRTPLLRNPSGGSGAGAPNPFQDQGRV
ncbi:hypothetical protein EDB81DRAFT_809595 [Dactylonectria macrodidyma]|uniref:Uncharacterized protein n=1 Tax=Dactylonectria macrodidyma TaxID=307937 RepID=A0A9P9DYL9_9HYPO|nr:hypothetical protein EDB81DRAFT_809595 [Dactylonectria macrodidyma]